MPNQFWMALATAHTAAAPGALRVVPPAGGTSLPSNEEEHFHATGSLPVQTSSQSCAVEVGTGQSAAVGPHEITS